MTKQRKPTDLQAQILQRLCDGYLMIFGVGTQRARLENREGDRFITCYSTIYRMRKLGWIGLGTITDAGREALRGEKKYIVELSPGCWLAPWAGDPGRTMVEKAARRYDTKRGASIALGMARRYRPLLSAKIVEVEI